MKNGAFVRKRVNKAHLGLHEVRRDSLHFFRLMRTNFKISLNLRFLQKITFQLSILIGF